MHLRKQEHIILSAGTRESILSVYPILLHKKGPPKQLAQTPLSRYLCFLMGSQKKGEGQSALLQDGKKGCILAGNTAFPPPEPERDTRAQWLWGNHCAWMRLETYNGKGLASSESLVGWGRGRRWRLNFFFFFSFPRDFGGKKKTELFNLDAKKPEVHASGAFISLIGSFIFKEKQL